MVKFYIKGFIKLVILSAFFLYSICIQAQSGSVFRDFNNNGIRDKSEGGVAGIAIQSFKTGNVVFGRAVSDAQGAYTLSPAAAANEPVRIEFFIPDSLKAFFPAAMADGAGNNGTSVQFATGSATNINFGINRAIDFCEAGPPVSIVCFIIGSGTTIGSNLLATVPANATGVDGSVVGHPNAPGASVGAVWGTSFQNETDRLFLASFMRRHTAFGTAGTGAIYVTTRPRDPAKSASYEFINLNGLTVNHARGGKVVIRTGQDPHQIPNYIADIIHDGKNPADSVGKMSLGDMDMSSDGKALYVVSLYDKRLYRILIDSDSNPLTNPTASDVLAFDIPDPGCRGGQARPFGLGIRGDEVFVGVTCDAGTSRNRSDLRAYVYKLNTMTNTFSEVISIPLDYQRGNVAGITFSRLMNAWQPWTNDPDWHNDNAAIGEVYSFSNRPEVLCPQPLLSDIVFDDDGSLVLGFMDRFGHQAIYLGPDPAGSTVDGHFVKVDPRAGGDVIRICNTGTLAKPVYAVESLGKCGSLGGGQFTEATYANPEYEYYTGDNFNDNSHTETAMGSLGLVPGSGELIVSAFDPINERNNGQVFTNGFKVLSNKTGRELRGFSLLNDVPANNGNNEFGKASGLGGVEVLCLPKPIEIGNLIWLDQNVNRIQDPGEPPIPGVQLELYNTDGQVVGRTTSNAAGHYAFNSTNVMDTVGVQRPNRPGPQIETAYTIRVAASQYNKKGFGPLTGMTLPATSQLRAFVDAPLGENEIRDNNGVLTNGFIIANVTTGNSGESDHTIDIGFVPAPVLNVSKQVNTVQARIGDILTYTVTIRNTGLGNAFGAVVQDVLSTNLTYLAGTARPSSGTFVAGNPSTWTIASLPANSSATLTYSVSVIRAGLAVNTATIPGDTAQVCTTIPYLVCVGQPYAISVSGPAGASSYTVYKDNRIVYQGPQRTYTATSPGAYRIIPVPAGTDCSYPSCCPLIIQEVRPQCIPLYWLRIK
ncbi:SdrD B-like domain-containing protein [Arsenicibacter rosenii]|uniref:DUF11 domain-containing protein n=1 Tax=Arsenicibacter rosenii TaxID=1750698 RepID=A0A1S2VQF8_9BACT|nr:SdrD B-like domain-containing protein [Arsenicibacter rosenii]OIN61017.1 hypothetical protein BLX24_02760 [Arsenicibacter rosenii]